MTQFKPLKTYYYHDEFSGKKHLFTIISITKHLDNKRGSAKIKYNDRIQECLIISDGKKEAITPLINTPTAVLVTAEMVRS